MTLIKKEVRKKERNSRKMTRTLVRSLFDKDGMLFLSITSLLMVMVWTLVVTLTDSQM